MPDLPDEPQQYSPLRSGSKIGEEEDGYVETPGRPEREAGSSGRDESVGCLVLLETGTCACCHQAGGLEDVDVGAMSRLLVALHGFTRRPRSTQNLLTLRGRFARP